MNYIQDYIYASIKEIFYQNWIEYLKNNVNFILKTVLNLNITLLQWYYKISIFIKIYKRKLKVGGNDIKKECFNYKNKMKKLLIKFFKQENHVKMLIFTIFKFAKSPSIRRIFILNLNSVHIPNRMCSISSRHHLRAWR